MSSFNRLLINQCLNLHLQEQANLSINWPHSMRAFLAVSNRHAEGLQHTSSDMGVRSASEYASSYLEILQVASSSLSLVARRLEDAHFQSETYRRRLHP